MRSILETARCELAPPRIDDRDSFVDLVGSAAVRRYLGGPLAPEAAVRRFAEICSESQGRFHWAARTKDGGAFVGMISLAPHHESVDKEISYQICPKFWGNGFGSELVAAVVAYAFNELKLPRLLAETQAANDTSRKLLESQAFTPVRTLRRFGAMQTIYVREAGTPS